MLVFLGAKWNNLSIKTAITISAITFLIFVWVDTYDLYIPIVRLKEQLRYNLDNARTSEINQSLFKMILLFWLVAILAIRAWRLSEHKSFSYYVLLGIFVYTANNLVAGIFILFNPYLTGSVFMITTLVSNYFYYKGSQA
jgi:hypothetical protein